MYRLSSPICLSPWFSALWFWWWSAYVSVGGVSQREDMCVWLSSIPKCWDLCPPCTQQSKRDSWFCFASSAVNLMFLLIWFNVFKSPGINPGCNFDYEYIFCKSAGIEIGRSISVKWGWSPWTNTVRRWQRAGLDSKRGKLSTSRSCLMCQCCIFSCVWYILESYKCKSVWEFAPLRLITTSLHWLLISH